jgi:Flp pilus assembly protein, pilin Flp
MINQEKINRQLMGQGIIEYTLILVLIALVVIVVLKVFGPALGAVFSQIGSQVSSF